MDGTDGISAESGLSLTAAEIRISKAGGNTVAKNSGNCTHDENGMYQCTFDATDTNTAGTIRNSGILSSVGCYDEESVANKYGSFQLSFLIV
ncbi:hypothetical protein IIC45_00805 [Patescibacteria group bacterium]|nr:hypothetical protein [Patescibacteria group bacterium]